MKHTISFSEGYSDRNRDTTRVIENELRRAFGMPNLVCTYGQESVHRARLVVATGDPGTPQHRILAEVLYPHDLPERRMPLAISTIIEDVQIAALVTEKSRSVLPKKSPRT